MHARLAADGEARALDSWPGSPALAPRAARGGGVRQGLPVQELYAWGDGRGFRSFSGLLDKQKSLL